MKVSLRAVSMWAAIGIVIFGILGYFLTQPTFLSACPLLASTRVPITSPVDGSAVPIQEIVQGTACHIPQDKELWVMEVVAGVSYFPQNGPIPVSSDGKWNTTAYIGPYPADVGRAFVLYTALADQEGKAAIQQYFKTAPHFQPLKPPLKGIQLMSQVVVIRLDYPLIPPPTVSPDYTPVIINGLFAVSGGAIAGLIPVIGAVGPWRKRHTP